MSDLDKNGIDEVIENFTKKISNINKQLDKNTPKKVFKGGEYCIWLISIGDNYDKNNLIRKLEVVAKIQEYFGKGIAVNKRLVDNLPSKLEINLAYEECLNIQKDFNSIGCEIKVLKVNEPLHEGKFKIELLDVGEDKIETAKKLKEYFKIDNASALRMLNNLPVTLLENVSFEKCLEAQEFFDASKYSMQISKFNIDFSDKQEDAKAFEGLVVDSTEKTFIEMSRQQTKSPYTIVPSNIEENKVYSSKRKKYIARINQEKKDFNNSLNAIINKQKERLQRQERNRLKREENRKKFFFTLGQVLITLICILPIAFLDYIGIKYIFSKFDGGLFVGGAESWFEAQGLPIFLGYMLSVPIWVGVAYIIVASLIRKLGKKAYSEENYKKYAQPRWILMLILSIAEAIISCIFLGVG